MDNRSVLMEVELLAATVARIQKDLCAALAAFEQVTASIQMLKIKAGSTDNG